MKQIENIKNSLTEPVLPQQYTKENTKPLDSENLEFRYGFKLGNFGFLLPKTVLSEVITNPAIYPIPNTTPLMKGLISIRGNFAIVVDLNEILELKLEETKTSVMVLQIESDYIAFPFDSAHSLELPSSVTEETLTVPETVHHFLGNTYKIDQFFWFEFDFKTCISQFINQIHQ